MAMRCFLVLVTLNFIDFLSSYQLGTQIINKFGQQILNQYASDLENIQIGTQIRYGCWCLFEVQQLGANQTIFLQKEGKGGAVDEIDKFCKL